MRKVILAILALGFIALQAPQAGATTTGGCGYADPTVGLTCTSPVADHSYIVGQTISIQLSMATPTAPSYDVSIQGQKSNDGHDWSWADSTVPFSQSWTPTSVDSFTLYVLTPGTNDVAGQQWFSTYPVVTVKNVSVTPTAFYPLVKDGFRDLARVKWTQNVRADQKVTIRNRATGNVVRTESWSNQASGTWTWGWNGHNNAGSRVRVGTYRITVTVKAFHQTKSQTVAVKVATGWKTVKKGESKHGTETSSRSSQRYSLGGNCNWLNDGGQLLTTCLFAKATVSYNFKVPRGATLNTVSVRYHNGLEACRNTTKSVSRSGATVTVRFSHGNPNGFSQCWIGSASVVYSVKVKI